MKHIRLLSRANFIITANLAWAGQFVIAFLVPLMPDYQLWRREIFRPDYQIGCFEDAYQDSSIERLYILGLVWLVTTPVMNLIACRSPAEWPGRIKYFWWNGAAQTRSWLTLILAAAVMLWPFSAGLNAPVAGAQLLEGARTLMLGAVLFYYRSVLLSA
jgi:hypothetical protein